MKKTTPKYVGRVQPEYTAEEVAEEEKRLRQHIDAAYDPDPPPDTGSWIHKGPPGIKTILKILFPSRESKRKKIP